MGFVKVARLSEISPMKMVGVNGNKILLVKLDNNVYAMEGICSHKGAPLNEGSLNGKVLTCPWHQSQFDVTSGEIANVPFDQSSYGKVYHQKKYEVILKKDEVFINV